MSDRTVRRYKVNPFSQSCTDGDWMLYSDHRKVVDALRTQARELAKALKSCLLEMNCLNSQLVKGHGWDEGATVKKARQQAMDALDQAQAVLKEGA